MIFTSGGAGLFGIDLDLNTARNQFDYKDTLLFKSSYSI